MGEAESRAHTRKGRGGSGTNSTDMINQTATIKDFDMDPDSLEALAAALSPARLQTYRDAVGGDLERALRLHVWNTAASAALYGPLQALELALRNAMNTRLEAKFGHAWYDMGKPGLDLGCRRRVEQAKGELARTGYPVDPPHMVAALSFGFWISLLGPGGTMGTARPLKANYEMTLWRPALRNAFPHASALTRKKAHRPLDHLRKLRNRIAHHEPIFGRHLERDHERILEVAGWIAPDYSAWIARNSRLPAVLAARNDTGEMLF